VRPKASWAGLIYGSDEICRRPAAGQDDRQGVEYVQQSWRFILLANLQLIVNAPLFPNYATLFQFPLRGPKLGPLQPSFFATTKGARYRTKRAGPLAPPPAIRALVSWLDSVNLTLVGKLRAHASLLSAAQTGHITLLRNRIALHCTRLIVVVYDDAAELQRLMCSPSRCQP